MKDYEPIMSWGEDDAEIDVGLQRGDEAATVALLEELAGGGPVLELAIGTGRIALPLGAMGIRVDGIDFSAAMVAKLRAEPGGDEISVTIGDIADVEVSGTYRLIYVVYNSLFNILTQDGQVRCFENVASHLTADGSFVVEGGCTLGFLDRLRAGRYVEAEDIGVDAVGLDLLRLDPATQVLSESHVRVSREGVSLTPTVQRYAWPSELDLMARIAGLRLKERWGGWNRQPFTSTDNVVSVYGR